MLLISHVFGYNLEIQLVAMDFFSFFDLFCLCNTYIPINQIIY